MNVTVLGLGQMGAAIAAALVKAGHETTVWNRTPGKVVDGAKHASTVEEAIQASPVMLAVVSDRQTVRELVSGAQGRMVINLATGTPEEATETAAWAVENGIAYLDGAMLAVPQDVATPEAQFVYSGSKAVFDGNRDMLADLATSHYLGEDPSVAALWDSAILGVGYATLLGFFHAAALLDSVRTQPSEILPLVELWLKGLSGWMAQLSKEIETGDYGNGVSPVDMNRAAVRDLVRTSLFRGVNAAPLTPLQALLDRRSADGRGADSLSSVFELLRSEAGRPAR